MRTATLDELARGPVAADGTCEVTIGPISRQVWHLSNVSVQCIPPSGVTNPLHPRAKLYVGPSRSGQFIGGTYNGSFDNIPVSITLPQGARITVVWEGADPGGSCVLTPFGTMEVFQ
jgi:hypothetical protein